MSSVSYAGNNIKWNSASDAKPVADELDKAKELKCLKLEANTLGVEAAEVIGDALAKHPEFERAHWKDLFTGRLKTEIPQALKHLFSGIMRAKAKLIELDLSDNALGPVGVEGMVDFIKSPSCYSLQELRLNNNGLGIKGGTMLAEALIKLEENASKAGTPLELKIFICGRNRLENKGAQIFAKVFTLVKTLEEIVMPQNGIFHEGIAALAKSFSLNSHLRVLNLNDNTFTPKGAKAMAAELPNMSNLEVINFGDCLLKTSGAISVASALKENHVKLKELYLDSNEIRISGGIEIVKAIENKPEMSHLVLDSNAFGEEGAERLLELLKKMGKKNMRASLEENEEPDEDECEGNSEEEEEEEHESEEEESEEEKVQDKEDGGLSYEKVVSPLKRDFFVEPIKCIADEFLSAPSAARLLGLGDAPSVLLEEAKKRAKNANRDPDLGSSGSPEALIFEYFRQFMTVASLSTSTNKKVVQTVETATKLLAKEAFSLASENNLLSVSANCLLVHFGLIKSESKNFKIEWDLRGGVIALTKIVPENYFPKSVKSTLQFFFSRPGLRVDEYPDEKHKLLSSLFKAAID